MEKIFASICYLSMVALTYETKITGYDGPLLNYMGVAIGGTVLLAVGLYLLYQIPKLVMIAALMTSKFFLKCLHSLLRKTTRINVYRISVANRLKTRFDVVRWLYRQNSRLNMEIESLRSEVHSLNQDIKLVVSTWTPNLVTEADEKKSSGKKRNIIIANSLSNHVDFLEKESSPQRSEDLRQDMTL